MTGFRMEFFDLNSILDPLVSDVTVSSSGVEAEVRILSFFCRQATKSSYGAPCISLTSEFHELQTCRISIIFRLHLDVRLANNISLRSY